MRAVDWIFVLRWAVRRGGPGENLKMLYCIVLHCTAVYKEMQIIVLVVQTYCTVQYRTAADCNSSPVDSLAV